jgi:outer membrane protein TolC
VLLATLVGCAGYRSVPLPADTGTRLSDLTVPASTLLPGGLQTHPFDPSDGLDMTEVSMLAIAQSPDLRVQRAKAGVTRAQVFAAGLLPDPVFSMSRDQPTAGQVGATTAYAQGLSWDIGPLVTLAARRTAGRRAIEQVELDLLWSEWQTITQARLDFVHVQRGRDLVARLEREYDTVRPLAPRLQAALERGNITFDVATTGLNAASQVARQLSEARTSLAQAEQDLRDLLGLRATEPLPLVGDVDLPPLNTPDLDAALAALPRRRPDLRALQSGYASQEAKVRAAILGQFPTLSVGVTRAKDNTGISSRGFSVSVSLPLFDGNRAAIRSERATREQLHEEYEQRLLTARGEVARLLEVREILIAREAELVPHVSQLDDAAARATAAYERGSLEWTIYLGMRQSALAAAVELNSLRQTLAETRIGLAAVLAGDWDPRARTSEEPRT